MIFVWKCFQDINFHWVVFRPYEQTKESAVRLTSSYPTQAIPPIRTFHPHLKNSKPSALSIRTCTMLKSSAFLSNSSYPHFPSALEKTQATRTSIRISIKINQISSHGQYRCPNLSGVLADTQK